MIVQFYGAGKAAAAIITAAAATTDSLAWIELNIFTGRQEAVGLFICAELK
jgi:hypothetical protein